MSPARFVPYAWGVLVANLAVILWGAFVRASGSGAGCGEHWPLCNGEVLPRTESLETMIEFTHRATSGIALLLTVVLLVWAFKAFEKGHRVRTAAAVTLAFMLAEAALGAGLVLFGLVADDDSVARAIVMCMHLVNTLGLVAALALTAWWSTQPGRLRIHGRMAHLLGLSLAGMIAIGITGAIAALGDTLFPATGLIDGIRADFDVGAHFLLRLRAAHPTLAVLVAGGVVALIPWVRDRCDRPQIGRLGRTLTILVVAQVILGFVNLGLLAPVWMQMIHLLIANLVWIALVLFSATALDGVTEGSIRTTR